MFFSDWGLIPYAEAWQRQTEWFDSLIQAKQNNDVYENHIVFCEHPHVYTLGRSGKENNMLLSEAQLEKIGATLYHIDRGRLAKATGVWLEGDTARARKICAIGVRSSHYVTMHGLALNVNTDLRYFSYIHPCGFIDKGVTSLRQELGGELPMSEVKQRLELELSRLLTRK